jgi:hypothetical protein
MAQCSTNCYFAVSTKQDMPGGPTYPVVCCAVCNTTWVGHRTDFETKLPNPRIPDALRDAVLLDQADRFEELLAELGYKKLTPSEAREGLHQKLRMFLTEMFVLADTRQWRTLDLIRVPGGGYRDEPLHRWARGEQNEEIPTLVSDILERAEAEVEGRALDQPRARFALRVTQVFGARHVTTFSISAPDFCVRTEAA